MTRGHESVGVSHDAKRRAEKQALPGRRHGLRHLWRAGRRRPACGGAAEASAGGVTAAGVHAAPAGEMCVIGGFHDTGWRSGREKLGKSPVCDFLV